MRKKKPAITATDSTLFGDTNPMLIDAEERYVSLAASTSRTETRDFPLQSFPNIENFVSPFQTSAGDNFIDAAEAIRLSVKAYWAYPLLRNVVEVMGELANSNLFLKGGNESTRSFVEAWWKKVNLWQLKEQFFREWFRSANCFVYRYDSKFQKQDMNNLKKVYGALNGDTIPAKYILLNPATIVAASNLDFSSKTYYKELTGFELARLKNPKTEEDKEFIKQLAPSSLKDIKNGTTKKLELDPARLNVLLYKAQPYEPMGVPMAYGVLKDIEAKLELKRIDLSIARTTDRALLLLTVGETPNEYHRGNNLNPATLQALQAAFANEAVARTLIADYTVKGEWLIPDINKILGAQKYEQLDKDISQGLNAILFDSGEKFANTSIKVQIFIERLKEARSAFLNNFLQPEIIKVCKTINAKSYPVAQFEDLSLRDELQYAKLAVSMAQLGMLTFDELYEVLETGKLPLKEDSITHQREYKTLREEGLYLPLIGGATEIQKSQLKIQDKQVDNQLEIQTQQVAVKKQAALQPKGRPAGSKSPRATTTPSPVSKSNAALEGFSLAKMREVFAAASSLQNNVEKALKKSLKLKELNEESVSLAKTLSEVVMANEKIVDWDSKFKNYLAGAATVDEAVDRELDDLQIQFDVDSYTASMLRHCKTE